MSKVKLLAWIHRIFKIDNDYWFQEWGCLEYLDQKHRRENRKLQNRIFELEQLLDSRSRALVQLERTFTQNKTTGEEHGN